MKTKTIEQQARELKKSLGFAMSDGSAVSRIEEALQERDRIAREEEREKIANMLKTTGRDIKNNNYFANEVFRDGYIRANIDVLKALTTPLTDKE